MAWRDHYEYDGDGRRVKQTTNSTSTFYLWSSVFGQPALELNSSGGVVRAYVFSSSGQRIATQASNGSFYWVHGDHLGSSHMLTDTSGSVAYRAEYDPHGNLRLETGTTTLTTRKFTGYEREAANLDNANARTYGYRRGRFMQPDPLMLGSSDLSNPQSLNLYSYVQNDPINATDPTGMLLALVCSSVDWTGWNDQGESVTGSTTVCTLIDIGGPSIGGPGIIDPQGGGSGGGQNPPPLPIINGSLVNIPITPPNPDCDKKLASIFGGPGAVAAGSGYEPAGLRPPHQGSAFNAHVFASMHIYATPTGDTPTSPVGLYIPAGGGRPFSRERNVPGDASYGINYKQLGALSNVTLVTTHVGNFKPRVESDGRVRIGDIGGPGGNSKGYVHSHLGILGRNGEKYSFVDAFCK